MSTSVTLCFEFFVYLSFCKKCTFRFADYTTDSVRNEIRTTHDTLLMRDTLLLHEYTRGDTVFRDRTETRWRERVAQRTDTVFLERVVQVAPTTTHKPNRSGWFLAGACAALLLLGVVGIVIRFH